MIQFTRGDVFAQPAEAIVNPVNCVGVMGRGLALQFKRRYPATAGADGEGEVVRSLEKGERGRDRERFPTRSSTHRHQPG